MSWNDSFCKQIVIQIIYSDIFLIFIFIFIKIFYIQPLNSYNLFIDIVQSYERMGVEYTETGHTYHFSQSSVNEKWLTI
jgi:hypothetical protein